MAETSYCLSKFPDVDAKIIVEAYLDHPSNIEKYNRYLLDLKIFFISTVLGINTYLFLLLT